MADQQNTQFTKGDQVDGFLHSFLAEGAITKDMIVELGTAYPQVKKHTTTQTSIVIGIAMETVDSAEMVVVCCFGPIKKVISDSNGITRGHLVIASGTTAGYCQSQSYADGTTLHGSLGIALETADESGEKVPVLCGWPGIVSNA